MPSGRSRWTLCFFIAASAMLQGCDWIKYSVIGMTPGFNLPECPQYGEWSKYLTTDKRKPFTVAAGGQLSLAGQITDVPEFHDCQKFIFQTAGSASYLPLYAIFARDSLRELTQRLEFVPDTALTATDSATVQSAGGPVAVGEVLALEQDYSPLGITKLFNCLFLYGTYHGLEAKMVQVGGDEPSCKTIVNPADKPGKILQVYRWRFKYDSAPPVARWDWDSVSNQQHLGIACGYSWCEVGAPGFHPSSAYATSSASPSDRVLAVKGWYDEQRLAVPATTGVPFSTASNLVVGSVKGTFVPMPDLGSDKGPPDGSRYDSTWVQVATAAMTASSSDYLGKLHMRASPVKSATNLVSLCYGHLRQCVTDTRANPKCTVGPAKQWWGKITNGDGKTAYFCVTRRGHESIPGLHIPGIVRWRWALKDETMWIRCLEGCCEVEAGSKDVL